MGIDLDLRERSLPGIASGLIRHLFAVIVVTVRTVPLFVPPAACQRQDAALRVVSRSSLTTEDTVQSIPKPTRPRRPWVAPVVADLPRLTDLTLSTGSPIPGMGNTGAGSVVTP